MKEKGKSTRVKSKDVFITWFSVILVLLIFFVQCFLLHRLYEANVDLLERELNISIDEVYQADLNRRLMEDAGTESPPKIKYAGTEKPEGVDSLKITTFKGDSTAKENVAATINLAIEQFLGTTLPIDLNKLDSIARIVFVKNNIKLNFYSEIVNVKTNKVLSTSVPASKQITGTLKSKDIPLDVNKEKVLRLVLLNPMDSTYKKMAGMLTCTLILSIILLYSLYYQRRALAEQKEIVELKNNLFSDISHEMKRPLAVIYQVLSSFENENLFTNKELRTRNLKIAQTEINKMNDQTEMVLSMARDEEGLFKLNLMEFSLEELVSDLVDKYLNTSARPLDIDVIDTMKSPFVCADRGHIEHIISNLLANSIKYSHDPVIISVSLSEEGSNFCISVKDNGIGIPKDEQKFIFDRYYRVGELTESKGHGIGLNYVKRMVEKHKGKISIISNVNEGTEFIIKIPNARRNS